MNITKFKEGEIITRIEPNKNPHGDRSYMEDRMIFIGIEKNIIFLVYSDFGDEYEVAKLPADWWGDGWDYFPETLWKKAIAKAKKLTSRKK